MSLPLTLWDVQQLIENRFSCSTALYESAISRS